MAEPQIWEPPGPGRPHTGPPPSLRGLHPGETPLSGSTNPPESVPQKTPLPTPACVPCEVLQGAQGSVLCLQIRAEHPSLFNASVGDFPLAPEVRKVPGDRMIGSGREQRKTVTFYCAREHVRSSR